MSGDFILAGNKKFKTKKSLTDHCKYILNNAGLGSTLRGVWSEVLKDVVKMHDNCDEKTLGQDFEVGVRSCHINPKNRQFFIKRFDGSTMDFSYVKAISGARPKYSQIKEALRYSVRDQTEGYKKNYFKENQDSQGYVICPETKLKVKMGDSNIDHYPTTFEEIVYNWVSYRGLTSEVIELVNSGIEGQQSTLKDGMLLEDFKQYHFEKAKYRIVLNKVNLQRKKPKKFIF